MAIHHSTDGWEKRYNPLRREWVVYAAHRNSRPWNGESVGSVERPPAYDSNCYLCPGNQRVSGRQNPEYSGIYTFMNDHPVVSENIPVQSHWTSDLLYQRKAPYGNARVICYSPFHDKTMAELSIEEVTAVLNEWRSLTTEAKLDHRIRSILIFENKGRVTGVSNLHPHCQVYETDFVFAHTERELESCRIYVAETGKNLFEDIFQVENRDSRVIAGNETAIAFIPFFGRYAFEVMILPRSQFQDMSQMSQKDCRGLAEVLLQVIRKYDGLYHMSFPYVLSVMQAPLDDGDYSAYRMYIHIQPPLRQPGLKKYLAGPEIGGGNFMADTLPEKSAEQLRNVKIDS